ncbi:ROK family protein [Spirillospora sp. CA-294931]|uniref:ROK family protein n=1 Tax=Spirillospora sp. CA-294931 TaxID=3240042 RepID=UPI003D8B5E1A
MRNKSPRTAPELRVQNRGLLLRVLRDNGPVPRSELARRTGLSATTITKVVAGLIDEGLVTEGGDAPGEGRVGRPAIDVALVREARAVCGVQVRGGAARVGLCDLRAGLITGEEIAFARDTDPAEVLDRIAALAGDLIDRSGYDRERILGVGVAAPGPVDAAERRNVLSINLGWRDVPFADHLEGALGLPTVVDHNVRAMALAESRYGIGADNLLYVYVRTGVGAGLVIGGRPFRPGAHGVTELGHLRVVEKGRRCACGSTGCLETVVSEPILLEQIQGTIGLAPGQGVLAALEGAAEAGDARATTILDELVEHLTTALASAVNLLNPELIVLGGVFADAPGGTLDRVRTSLYSKAFPILRDSVRLASTSLGLDAGVIGGAASALDRFFYAE